MGVIGTLWGAFQKIAGVEGKDIQSETQSQDYRDYWMKGSGYSVECDISEALADLMLLQSSMPISGDSERAIWLDDVSDYFFRNKAKTAITTAFETGDCLIVPSWTGRNIQNVIVGADEFEILEAVGDEVTAVAYVVDRTTKANQEYTLFQAIELVPYSAQDGSDAYANRYRMFVAKGENIIPNGLQMFPQWNGLEKEWYIPNVDRLLVGRYRSFTINPTDINAIKGAPICFGAGEHIKEIHYLLEQMHEEFDLSEKGIMADKRLFKKEWRNGFIDTVLPHGKERLFMEIGGQTSEFPIKEWAPDIRYQAYLDDIDKQEKLVERAVGVSSGIISTPEDISYQNVDNVRKSQQKTMGFISSARRQGESCMLGLVYSWNVLANYYGINPIGDYDVNFDWSNEYIETFGDRQQAILAGAAIGATDAVDYRMFVMDESPETARDRVAEIQAANEIEPMYVEEVV